jgi:hypothetical protein
MDQRLQFLSSHQKEEMSVADLCRAYGISRPTAYRWINRYNGKSVLRLMISLCPGCHAKVHRTIAVLTEMPLLLLELWREQHPQGHEQTILDFKSEKPAASPVPLLAQDGSYESRPGQRHE